MVAESLTEQVIFKKTFHRIELHGKYVQNSAERTIFSI